MKKTALWLMRLLVVSGLVLAACGAPAAATEEPTVGPPTELLVWADELRAPIITDLGNQFAADFGVTLVVQEMGFGDIRDQLAVAGPAGEGPDIIIGAHDWLAPVLATTVCGA